MNSREIYSNPNSSKNYDNRQKYVERHDNKDGVEKKNPYVSQQALTPTQSRNFISQPKFYQESSEFFQRDYQRIKELSLGMRNERDSKLPIIQHQLQQPQQKHLALHRVSSNLKNKPENSLKNERRFDLRNEEPTNIRYSQKYEYHSSRNNDILHGDSSSNRHSALSQDPRNYKLEPHPNKINYRQHEDIYDYKYHHPLKDPLSHRYNNLEENFQSSRYETRPVDPRSKSNNTEIDEHSSKKYKDEREDVLGNKQDYPSNDSTIKVDRKTQEGIHNHVYNRKYEDTAVAMKLVKQRYSDKPTGPIEVKSCNKHDDYHSNYRYINKVEDRSTNISRSLPSGHYLQSPQFGNKSRLPPHFINIYAEKPEYAKKSAISLNNKMNYEILPERYDSHHKKNEIPLYHYSVEDYSSHLQSNYFNNHIRTGSQPHVYEKPENSYSDYKVIERSTDTYDDKENSARYGRRPNVSHLMNQARESAGRSRLDNYSNINSREYFNPYKEFYSQNNLKDKIAKEQKNNYELFSWDDSQSTEVPYSLEGLYEPPKDGEHSSGLPKRSKKYYISVDEAKSVTSEESRTESLPQSQLKSPVPAKTKSKIVSYVTEPAKLLDQMPFKKKRPVVPFPDYTLPRNIVPVVLPSAEASVPKTIVQKVYTHDIGDY